MHIGDASGRMSGRKAYQDGLAALHVDVWLPELEKIGGRSLASTSINTVSCPVVGFISSPSSTPSLRLNS